MKNVKNLGYTRKQANKDWWFDEEGEWGKERRQGVSHPKQHQRSQECLQTSPDEREAFVQKKCKAARRRGFNRDWATAKYSGLSVQASPDKIHTIHKTLIGPVLLCGSKPWVLTKREEHQLFVFERKDLRTICVPEIENGVYKRRSGGSTTNSIKSLKARMS
jgi:hypothetical protein